MATIFGRNWSRQELSRHVGHRDQLAGIKLVEAADGTERGVRILEVWTGTGLFFHVLADRALDISTCSYKGIPLAWHSSTGDVHPAYYDANGKGWLRSFPGGLLATCGLDTFGAPSTDEGTDYGIHGRIGNVPARYLSYRTYWEGDEYLLEISGEVRQTQVFGENLVLRRRISTRLGSNEIKIEDTVTNEGFAAQPHMILYHCNVGFPLLDASTQLHVEDEQTLARDSVAEAGLQSWNVFQEPTANYSEQVFHHLPKADAHGQVNVEVRNPDLGIGLRWRYNKTSLPHLFEWKQMGEGIYVLGIEPANSSAVEGRKVARDRDDLPHLQPGESRSYALSIEVIEG